MSTNLTSSPLALSKFIVYLYNILGWSSFPSIRPIIRPSKFLIPKEEDDGMGGWWRLMVAAAIYPHVHVILLAQFVLALRNCFCVVCRNLTERAMEGQQQQKPNGGTEKKGTSLKLPKRGDILWGIVTPKEFKSKRWTTLRQYVEAHGGKWSKKLTFGWKPCPSLQMVALAANSFIITKLDEEYIS